MQVPQSMQYLGSISAFLVTVIALEGQTWEHIPHPVHLALSIFTFNITKSSWSVLAFSFYYFNWILRYQVFSQTEGVTVDCPL